MIAQAKWHAEIVTVAQLLLSLAVFACCCTRTWNSYRLHYLSVVYFFLSLSFHCQVRVRIILNISLYCGRPLYGLSLLVIGGCGLNVTIEMKIKVISFSFSSSTSTSSLSARDPVSDSLQHFISPLSLSHSPGRLNFTWTKLHGSSSIFWSLKAEELE